MDIRHESPINANDPNRGLNVKVFLIVVAVAAVIIAVTLAIGLRKGDKAVPTPTQSTGPSSSLSLPHIYPPKPSPLHPIELQASSRPARIR